MRKGKEGPRSRGIGFAQVPNDQKDAVLALAGKDIGGRPFDVQVAKVQVRTKQNTAIILFDGEKNGPSSRGARALSFAFFILSPSVLWASRLFLRMLMLGTPRFGAAITNGS